MPAINKNTKNANGNAVYGGKMEKFIIGKVRVELLSEEIVRIELMRKKKFSDKNTFLIPNLTDFNESQVAHSFQEGVITFGDYELYVPEDATSLKGISLKKNGVKVYSYKPLKNSGELPAPVKTPEVFALADSTRIYVPEGGYSAKRKGNYKVEENVKDIYLLLCNKNAKKLRELYVSITGRCELVRLSTLGSWNSKYYAYTQDEAKQVITDYENHDVPLDNIVIDTDWRTAEQGWGYDINTKLFPDMKGFMDFAHSHGVEVMFNDHPEPVNGLNIFAPEEIAYREKNLQALMEIGLDTWWYDRNWHTKLVAPTPNIPHETFGMYLFESITENFYKKQAKKNGVVNYNEVYKRPVIMANVDNIANGVYVKMNSSASHRYSIQWTGDIFSEKEDITQEVENLIKGGDNCIAYINADCGGHQGNPDKETFIRWMQFGTLSPVFRPHCTNIVKKFREPWLYDEETLDIVRECNKLRYRLLPVIYSAAKNNYDTGEPIFKSLAYEYPTDKKAGANYSEYMLGKNLLIAPVGGTHASVVPKNCYTAPVTVTYYDGRELKGEPIVTKKYDQINMILAKTSLENGVPVYDFSARFETKVKFNDAVKLMICIDDGATVYVDGKEAFRDDTLHSAMTFFVADILDCEEHDIRIDYFQAGGEAACILKFRDCDERQFTYLPEGKWIFAADGKVYSGKRSMNKEYALKDTPLFIRSGAVIPLVDEAQNTKEQKWNKLAYNIYPDKEVGDSGVIYEDDGETTAYKLGEYRTCAYDAKYDDNDNTYCVNLYAAEGEFKGERAVSEREITLNFNLLKGFAVKKVTVNGEEVKFTKIKKDANSYPLSTNASCVADFISVKTNASVYETLKVKFYLT